MRKINEIFYSLQGEGFHVGTPAVFIRFSGCNLQCPFCDTRHRDGVMMTDDEIVNLVNLYQSSWIILTGGEPSLYIDEKFIDFLHRATDKKIAIETNGTCPLPHGIDWVTLSPKTGISGAEDLPLKIERTDEIKVVDMGQPLEEYFRLSCRKENTHMYLQPCWVPDKKEFRKNIESTVKRVCSDPRWSLSIQIHRYLNIP